MPPATELAERAGVTAKVIMSSPSYKKLDFAQQWIEEGMIKAKVAKTMKLERAAEAQDLLSAGGLNGKVVLEVNQGYAGRYYMSLQ